MRRNTTALLVAMASLVASATASAQDVVLRVHHFMSAKSTLHTDFLMPLASSLDKASDGRIKLELFDSMSLGGRPGDLYDQAVDGAVDIVLTLPGYTAGRFNRSEVFELPFMMEDPIATSGAFWDLIDAELQNDEFDETHILAGWVHGPGVIHSKEPINTLQDMTGQEMRGPTRVVTDLLGTLGATPVGMPLPAVPENLSKGVINGTVLPWEVTPSVKLSELVGYHTEFSGQQALYTATFIMAMNIDVYEEMPDELRAILDEQAGKRMSEFAATAQLAGDAGGRQIAIENGNSIIELDNVEVARWVEASLSVYDRWIARAADEGFDGVAAIEQARSLITANQ